MVFIVHPLTDTDGQTVQTCWLSAGGRKYDDVAQVSKPAVSRISKSASTMTKDGLPTGKSAIQQVGNLRYRIRHRICAPEHLAPFEGLADEARARRPAELLNEQN